MKRSMLLLGLCICAGLGLTTILRANSLIEIKCCNVNANVCSLDLYGRVEWGPMVLNYRECQFSLVPLKK